MNTKMSRFLQSLLLLLSILALASCGKSSSSAKVLRVGFVPAEDAQQVIQNAQPIVEALQHRLGMEVQPFVATDYTGAVEALRANNLDSAFLTSACDVMAKNEANEIRVLKSETKGSRLHEPH